LAFKVIASLTPDSQDIPPFVDDHNELDARTVEFTVVEFEFPSDVANVVFDGGGRAIERGRDY
jgi:hypothetical protein